jgi:hypothetical protein
MTDDEILREKLRKIEALYAGAATPGEKAAADAAAQRIRARLKESQDHETAIEMKFRMFDPWSRQLFIALSRRYGLRPYRYPRMRRQTIMLKAPQSFLENILWPEFQQINSALQQYLSNVTNKVISEQVYPDLSDAEEVDSQHRPAYIEKPSPQDEEVES